MVQGMTRVRPGMRILIALAGACTALAVTELIVTDIVGYPHHIVPRTIHLDDELGRLSDLTWEAPRSRVWNVEGGGIVHEYNNLGLSGCDVRTGDSSRYVFVLGDSYVEAQQVHAGEEATSVFQRLLDSARAGMQVINLGLRHSDPYASWYRMKFFERQFAPSCVILVMEQFYANWLNGYAQPLSFHLTPSFGTAVERSAFHDVVATLRMHSSLCNMLVEGYYTHEFAGFPANPPPRMTDEPVADRDSLTDALRSCLRQYHDELGSRFLVVSIAREPSRDSLLTAFCRELGVACETDIAIASPSEHIAGKGHLNLQGNNHLGRFLYAAFARHFPAR